MMSDSSTFPYILRLFILILLITGLDTNTYAFDSYAKAQRMMVPDTISETVLAEMARSDRKEARMAMRVGVASIFTVFSLYPGSLGWLILNGMRFSVFTRTLGIWAIISVALAIIAMALGVFALVKRRKGKAFSTAGNAKYIKETKWMAIVSIIFGVVSVLLMMVRSSSFVKDLLIRFI